MKIIQANKYYFRRGGTETYLLDLSHWLNTHGHSVIPFAMAHPENLPTPFEASFPSMVDTQKMRSPWQGIRTLARMLYSFEARRKLATLIHRVKPDVVHIHNLYTQLSPSLLHTCADQSVPVVMTVHDHHLTRPHYLRWVDGCSLPGDQHGRLKRWISSWVFRWHQHTRWYQRFVTTFIVPSRYLEKEMIQNGFSKEQICVVPFGVDITRFTPAVESEPRFVLYVGRLSNEKGVMSVLEIAKRLPDISFKIVGTGPQAKSLHRVGHQLKNVTFIGFTQGEALVRLYQEAFVTLIPSRVHETFGLTAIESMACGTPVIASRVGALPEIIKDHRTGFLVAPLDVSAWTEAVMRLVYDQDLRRQFSLEARTRIAKHFNDQDHWSQIVRVYQSVRN